MTVLILPSRRPGAATRVSFGRSVVVIDESLVVAGSQPSTIAPHDLEQARTRSMVTRSRDIRNAIQGPEVWPFG